MSAVTEAGSKPRRALVILLVLLLCGHAILATLYVASRLLGGELGQYEQQLESFLQTATGLDWRVSGLRMEWRGLNPVVYAARAQAQPSPLNQAPLRESLAKFGRDDVLLLEDLQAYVDVGRTLFARQLRLFGLRTSRASIVLEQREDRFSLAGLRAGSGKFALAEFAAQLRYAQLPQLAVAILPATLAGSSADGEPNLREMPVLQLALRAGQTAALLLQTRELSGSGDALDGVQLRAKADGEWLAAATTLRAHFAMGGERGEQWGGLLGTGLQASGMYVEGWAHKPAFSGLQAGALVKGGGFEFTEAHTQKIVARIPAVGNLALPRIANAIGTVHADWASRDDFTLAWRGFSAQLNQRNVVLPDGRFTASRDWLKRRNWSLLVDSMDLITARRELNELQILPAALTGLFDDIDPRGTLRDLEFFFADSDKREFSVRARLDALQAKAWKGAPAVNGLGGELELGQDGGVFRIAPDREFSVGFPTIYRDALSFKSARGEVSWQIDGARLLIDSSEMALSPHTHSAAIGARFSVNARLAEDDDVPSQMRLRIGYTDAELQNLLQYVPYTLPADVRSWLADSNVSGPSSQGGFIYNGSLKKGDRANRDTRLFVELDGAQANYAPAWPRAENLQGLVTISSGQTDIALRSATVASVPLNAAAITIGSDGKKTGLTLDTGVAGSLGSVLSLLKSSPAGAKLLPVIDDWRASGALRQARLRLSGVLKNLSLAPTQLSFGSKIADGSLHMPRLDLTLENLRGAVAYDLQRGLHSEALDASLFGEPWRIVIGSDAARRNAADELYLSAQGAAPVAALQSWLKLPVLGFASGRGKFDIKLEQNEVRSELRVSSDLRGIAMEAPLPFYKLAQRVQPFSLQWDLRRAEQPLVMAMPGLLDGYFEFGQFEFSRGRLALGGGAASDAGSALQDIDKGRLVLGGALAQFNFAAWQDAYQRYQQYDAAAREASRDSKKAVRLDGRGISIAKADGFGQQLENLAVDFSERDDDFLVSIASSRIKGEVTVPRESSTTTAVNRSKVSPENAPAAGESAAADVLAQMPSLPDLSASSDRLRLDLDFLHLEGFQAATAASTNTNTSSSPFSPEDLLPVAVDIRELTIDGKAYGAWKFLLSASDSAALAHAIDGNLNGLSIKSDSDDGLLWAYDTGGMLNTALSASLASTDLAGFLEKSLDEPGKVPLRAENFSLALALTWPGSPLDMGLQSLNGSVDVNVGSGRFYRVSESATGFLKLLGLFNFDALLRRMQLDFRDVYKEGLSFDSINGELLFENPRVVFQRSPIEVRSPSSKFSLAGSVDLAASTIDAELVATMPVANNLPWIAALAGGLPVAAGTFIVTRVLGEQFDRLSSAVYSVRGPMDEPEVKFERLFDNKNSKSASAAK